jgi:SPP1 gp7 family putative phage head morphogenesis protein
MSTTDKPAPAAATGEPTPAAKHAHVDLEKKKSRVTGTDPDSKWIEAGRKAMKPVIAAFLAEQAPKIAKQVASSLGLAKAEDDPKHKIDEALANLDFEDWQALPPQLEEAMTGIAVAGGKDALKQLGLFDDDIVARMTQRATDYAQQRSAEMVGMKYVDGELVPNPDAKWQITEGTREYIRSTVTQAEAEGWSTDQLSTALQDGAAFDENRADMIARTESGMADVAGNVEGWRASGVVDKKEWLAAPDCCDECQDLDGEIVDIDEPFPDGGGDGPPLHPNCRCNVLPVLSDETSDTGDAGE